MTRDEIKDICADEETQAKNKGPWKGILTSEILEDVANEELALPPEVYILSLSPAYAIDLNFKTSLCLFTIYCRFGTSTNHA